MKKAFLLSAVILITAHSFAQQKIAEGSMVFDVEYELPENMKPYAAFFPKETTVYFKGDSSVTIQRSPQSLTNMIVNAKTSFMRLLLVIESQGKKFSVNYTPADQEEAMMSLPEYTFTAGTETRVIAGFKATKYEAKDKKTGTVSEFWFSKEISAVPNSITMAFDPSLGTPLSFSTNQRGMVTKFSAKEIKAGTVAPGIFSTPKDFEAITPAQLKAMQGGR